MKLISEYGNVICEETNPRKIEQLKDRGYREMPEKKKEVKSKDDKKATE